MSLRRSSFQLPTWQPTKHDSKPSSKAERCQQGRCNVLTCDTSSQVGTPVTFQGSPRFGWRTTHFVESEKAKSFKLKSLMVLPFDFFKSYATLLVGDVYARKHHVQLWIKGGRAFTPRAAAKLRIKCDIVGHLL